MEWEVQKLVSDYLLNSALSVDQSSLYDTVKGAVLKAYGLVPEAYYQRFWASMKSEAQT